jgi:N,N'-diacetyllegionaminate synthase
MSIEIIAELAQGFEGNYHQTLLLIRAAAKSGADAAKFQLVYADELSTPDYEHYKLFKSLEMPDEDWVKLNTYAAQNNIELQVDIFGEKSLALAEKIGIKTVKIHCTDINNIDLLEKLSASKIERILLGVGGAHDEEIRKALHILENKNLVLLLGFQGYPTENQDNQIDRVRLFNELFKSSANKHIEIGFADHATPDTALRFSIAATSLGAGARVIEKHLTLGQIMELEDFESALNPDVFSEFVSTIKACYLALGHSTRTLDFGMSERENRYRENVRRHVVAKNELKKGHKIQPHDLVFKRTSSKQYISDIQSVYEKVLVDDVKANHPITANIIENI